MWNKSSRHFIYNSSKFTKLFQQGNLKHGISFLLCNMDVKQWKAVHCIVLKYVHLHSDDVKMQALWLFFAQSVLIYID